jgi:hypothetical protein
VKLRETGQTAVSRAEKWRILENSEENTSMLKKNMVIGSMKTVT